MIQVYHSPVPGKTVIFDEKSLFCFLDEVQQTHGLRTDDFKKYRQYCTRKLMRLRSKFHLSHSSKSGVKVTIDQCKVDSEYLHLVLFKCEWYTNQISQLRTELSVNSRKKHHLRSICRKALKYTANLKTLSIGTFESKSNLGLEYLAYSELFEGIVQNELMDFAKASLALEKAKMVIIELIGRDYCDLAVLRAKLTEIETIIRVCQYSADMQDVQIDISCELATFQVDHLKINTSTDIHEVTSIITFGNEPISSNISLAASLEEAMSVLKIQNFGSEEYKAALLQMIYFENRNFNQKLYRQICKILRCCSKKSILSVDTTLKSLIRSKGYGQHSFYSKYLDWIATVLTNLRCVYEAKLNNQQLDNLKAKINTILAVFSEMKSNMKEIELYQFKLAIYSLKQEARLNSFLQPLLNVKAKSEIVIPESAPVPPKPSFYDMAFDFITYEPVEASNSSASPSSGFSNLISSIWKR